jgi:hypothetical protein
MKTFLFKLAGFLSLQTLVLIGFLTPYFLNHKQVVDDGFMAATHDKHKLLERQPKPRIIFIGGSAFAFGNNSPLIAEQLTGYHPINMGLHAGLGMEYMLNEVKDKLQPGDVVVLSFEYENFIDFPPGPKDVFDVIEARWQNLQYLPTSYIPALLDKGLIFAGGVLRRSVDSLTGTIDRQSYYQRTSFNSTGDAIVHYDLASLTDKVLEDGKTFEFRSQDVQRGIQMMNAFNADCQAKGVRVFYAYPPLVGRLLEKSEPEIEKLEQELAQSLTFPILDKPGDVAYPDSYYFDTRYHLNKIGANARSQHLANRLSQKLKPEISRVDRNTSR